MKQRIHAFPELNEAEEAALSASRVVLFQVKKGNIYIASRLAEGASDQVRHIFRLKAAAAQTQVWLERQERLLRSHGMAKRDAIGFRKHYEQFFRNLLFSDAFYHVAVEMDAEGGDETLGRVAVWCMAAALAWHGQYGDVRAALEQKAEINRATNTLAKFFSGSTNAQRAAYKLILKNLKDQITIPDWPDPEQLGKRGGAFASDDAAKRGWLVRDLDSKLPPFEMARYAVVSKILDMIGVEGVTPAYVRGVLLSGRT